MVGVAWPSPHQALVPHHQRMAWGGRTQVEALGACLGVVGAAAVGLDGAWAVGGVVAVRGDAAVAVGGLVRVLDDAAVVAGDVVGAALVVGADGGAMAGDGVVGALDGVLGDAACWAVAVVGGAAVVLDGALAGRSPLPAPPVHVATPPCEGGDAPRASCWARW